MTAATSMDGFQDELRKCASIALPDILPRQRWFGGKARSIRSVQVADVIPIASVQAFILLAEVHYLEGPEETYVLPLVRSGGETQAGTRGDAGELNTLP